MIKAVGRESGRIYAEGKTRADLCKKLQELYPDYKQAPSLSGYERVARIYPEALVIAR